VRVLYTCRVCVRGGGGGLGGGDRRFGSSFEQNPPSLQHPSYAKVLLATHITPITRQALWVYVCA